MSGSRGRKNPYLMGAMGLSVAACKAAALFVPPLRAALGGAPLALADLGIALAGAALPSIAIEVSRFFTHHEQKALPAPGETSASAAPERQRTRRPADNRPTPSGSSRKTLPNDRPPPRCARA